MSKPTRQRKRRADAERSIAAIVDASIELLNRRPDANMGEIAAAAGVGRVTLYAHFPSREAVLAAARERAMAEAIAALDAADLDHGPASEALRRLVEGGWTVLDRHRGLLVAGGVSPAQLRAYHTEVLDRIERLIRRGQAEGEFRSNLASGWLVAAAYSLFHAAAQEAIEGRLDAADAAQVLQATLLNMLGA